MTQSMECQILFPHSHLITHNYTPPDSIKMATFTSLPPEIRNNIYDLLLHVDHPLTIVSPRKYRKTPNGHVLVTTGRYLLRPEKNFASLIRVNKMIGNEARTSFYGGNTWVVGNGPWGCRTEVNLHVSIELWFHKFKVPLEVELVVSRLCLSVRGCLTSLAGSQKFYLARPSPCC